MSVETRVPHNFMLTVRPTYVLVGILSVFNEGAFLTRKSRRIGS